MPEWHAIRAKPGAEGRAAIGVDLAGMRAFLPAERIRKNHRDGDRTVTWRALFPGYLFVQLEPSTDLSYLLDLDGVEAVLRTGGRLAPIPTGAIEVLQRAQTAGAFDRTITATYALRSGDQVRITAGPFAGMLARVGAAKAKKRITVLLDEIHKLSIPIDKVQRVGT